LLRRTVHFVVGPTQRTLPQHQFDHPLELVLLDGPHGYPFPELEYYYVYPQLREDALLIVDDIDVPTIFNFYRFLREDEMYRLVETVHTTAFFARTSASLFDPTADGWWLQNYNRTRYPVRDKTIPLSLVDKLKRVIPAPLRILLVAARAKYERARPEPSAADGPNR
jgi:hypothetical protein